MAQDVAAVRATALRVAKWLVDKSRPDEAVELLSAWAANGPNDTEGQQLLAEALRIDPSARTAQMAFERMEGISSDQAALEQAIARFSADAVAALDKEARRPNFRRAQMGFNNNIKYKGQVMHVQTEDSGLDAPHIITHLFADGGRVIKSHKRDYAQAVSRTDVAEFVRGLMKAQHLEMVALLREGRFEAIIAGKEVGGMSLLTEAPSVDIQKLATKKQQAAEAAPGSTPPAAAAAPEPAAPTHSSAPGYILQVLRSLTGGPEQFEPMSDVAIIGRKADIALTGERFCHPREAVLTWEAGRLWLEDLDGGNGVFLRVRSAVELTLGDEFMVGDQLLRIEKNPVADDSPDPHPTYFYSSPKWTSSFRAVQIFEGGAQGACVVAHGNTLQIGSIVGDLIFSDDPLVDQQHCVVEEQAGTLVLTDLNSRTGVFVRIRGKQELVSSDELLIGRTRLVVYMVNR
jgi:pSer/pThr/pTyr-binding forkhead associated (FHA) protein